MMNDLTGMEGRKLRMPSVSPLRVVGRVTGRQRGWALGINTIPFHFPASVFPVETATPQPNNLSSVWLREAMTVCNTLLRGVHLPGWIQVGWLRVERQEGTLVCNWHGRMHHLTYKYQINRFQSWNVLLLGFWQQTADLWWVYGILTLITLLSIHGTSGCIS